MNKKYILGLVFLIFGLSFVSAVDFDNITFTNEEFYNGAVTETKVIELSNGNIAVGYVASSTTYIKICDSDGTNCGTQKFAISSSNLNTLDMFDDPDNNRFIIVGQGSNGYYRAFDYDGNSLYGVVSYNTGSTNYVSAVQTNSTHFAIAFQDTADSSRGKVILCKLDGSSCGSENSLASTISNAYNKLILSSNGNLALVWARGTNDLLFEEHNANTGAYIGSGSVALNTGATAYIDMIEGSDNKLKIVYRDGVNSNYGTFRSCDLDGTNCGSEIVYESSSLGSTPQTIMEIIDQDLLAVTYDSSTGGSLRLFNFTGGEISNKSFITSSISYEIASSSVYTSENIIINAYRDGTNIKGMFAVSEQIISELAEIRFNDEEFYNGSVSTLRNNYWNLYFEDNLNLVNFSINFNGSGFEKYWNLPINNEINISNNFAGNDISGLTYNRDLYYLVDKDSFNNKLIILNKNGSTNKTLNLSTQEIEGTNLNNIVFIENIPYLYFTDLNNKNYLVENNLNFESTGNIINLTEKNINYSNFLFYDEIKKYLYLGDFGIGKRNIIEINPTNDFIIENIIDVSPYFFRSMTRYNNSYYFMNNLILAKMNLSFDDYTSETNFFSSGDCGSASGVSIANTGGILSMSCLATFDFYPYIYKLNFINYSNITNIAYYNAWNLSDGNYTIQFQAQNSTSSYNSEIYNFIIDGTAPIIVNNIPNESNSYLFNGSWFNCIDDNIDYCNITINGFNKESGTDFNLTNNGNLSYNIISSDTLGNTVNESGVMFVNPYAYFDFQLSNGTPVTNYTLAGTDFETVANFTFYSPEIGGLGTRTLLFEKLGYATQNITFNVTNTSRINITTNVTVSKIILTIKDRETNSLLLGLSEVEIVATNGFNGNTTTGLLNISDINFISEQYQLIVTHEGYVTENIFFNYNAQELLPVTISLIKSNSSNSGFITVKAISENGLFIQSALCSLKEWRPLSSAFDTVSQGITDVNGEFSFAIELNTKVYKALCTYKGLSSETLLGNAGIITESDTTTPIYLNRMEDVFDSNLENIDYSLTNETINSTHQRIIFTWLDNDGLATKGCLTLYSSTGFSRTQLSQTCTETSSGEIQIITNINNTYNLIAESSIYNLNGNKEKLEELKFLSTESFENIFKVYNLDLIIPIMLFFLGLGLGLLLTPQNIFISLIAIFIFEWVAYSLIPTTLSFTTVTFISVVIGFMLWAIYGGRR